MNLLKNQFGIVAALVMGLLFCGTASATPVRFDIDGHFSNIDVIFPVNGTFTGTMDVDADTGDLLSIDVLFPTLAAFTDVQSSSGGFFLPRWTIKIGNGSGDHLSLAFTTPQAPVSCGWLGCWGPGSLVDFAGGSIIGNNVIASFHGVPVLGAGFSGSITPAQASVPEPAALGMFGLGVLLIGMFAGLRRRVHQN